MFPWSQQIYAGILPNSMLHIHPCIFINGLEVFPNDLPKLLYISPLKSSKTGPDRLDLTRSKAYPNYPSSKGGTGTSSGHRCKNENQFLQQCRAADIFLLRGDLTSLFYFLLTLTTITVDGANSSFSVRNFTLLLGGGSISTLELTPDRVINCRPLAQNIRVQERF